jgi:hypothetical protein
MLSSALNILALFAFAASAASSPGSDVAKLFARGDEKACCPKFAEPRCSVEKVIAFANDDPELLKFDCNRTACGFIPDDAKIKECPETRNITMRNATELESLGVIRSFLTSTAMIDTSYPWRTIGLVEAGWGDDPSFNWKIRGTGVLVGLTAARPN